MAPFAHCAALNPSIWYLVAFLFPVRHIITHVIHPCCPCGSFELMLPRYWETMNRTIFSVMVGLDHLVQHFLATIVDVFPPWQLAQYTRQPLLRLVFQKTRGRHVLYKFEGCCSGRRSTEPPSFLRGDVLHPPPTAIRRYYPRFDKHIQLRNKFFIAAVVFLRFIWARFSHGRLFGAAPSMKRRRHATRRNKRVFYNIG